jgi:hypothetical protein
MLKQIYRQRYGKLLLGFCLVLVLIYAGLGWNTQRSWHNQKTYFDSETFKKDFQEHPDYYIKDYQGEKPIYYSIDEYTDENLLIFNKPVPESDGDYRYPSNFADTGASFILPLLLVFGFLSFFIDQKTNFNRFLFSLPFKKRQIFRQKAVFLLAPVSFALIIGILSNICIRYLMIPSEYFQIPLSDLFASGVGTFVGNLAVTAIGCFLGVLLGNLFFGLLSIVLIFFLLSGFYSFYYNLQEYLSFLFYGKGGHLVLNNLWNDWPNGLPVNWWAILATLLLSFVLIAAAQEVFARISLENDGDYLTVPAFRLPVFLAMAIGTWFYLINMNWMLVQFYYDDFSQRRTILSICIYLVVCLVVSFLLVYPKAIKKWWHARHFLNDRSSN